MEEAKANDVTCTVDGAFDLDATIRGRTLHEWVQLLHRANCNAQGWDASPLKRGCFGYHNLAMSAVHVLHASRRDLNSASEAVHDGWRENYRWWCTDDVAHRPGFYAPYKPVKQLRRDALCVPFAELPEEEKDKDRLLAAVLLAQADWSNQKLRQWSDVM
jgi:hypothetical protein